MGMFMSVVLPYMSCVFNIGEAETEESVDPGGICVCGKSNL